MDRFVLRLKERFQLSYELPHEAYRAHVYPRQSSNGSTVIIYGHEQGLRLVWYSGKPFQPPKKDAPTTKVNGTAKSDPMVIDLDDDDDDEPATTQAKPLPVEFEAEEEEVDPSAPYGDILRQLDIALGAAAARVAIPHVASDIAQAPEESLPPIYAQRIVIAAACTDLAVRIVAVPIDPPGPDVVDIAQMDVQVIKIFGPNFHQDFISDVAITHTGGLLPEQEDDDGKAKSRVQSRSHAQQEATEPDTQRWGLLVASISCTGPGLLLVHQIPVQNDRISASSEHFLPIRRQYLPCSAMSARLAFNTSPYPAERHSSLLISLPAPACVKLYQVFPASTRERRGSTATADSASSTRSARTSTGERGKFLATFLPSFSQDNTDVSQRRKRVLDAKWIAGGRAIVALLEDGEWGIWDLEAVGPASSNAGGNLIRGQSNISGIQGGGVTRFAVRSTILPSVETKQKSSSSTTAQSHQPSSGSLAPMTPSTRKVRSEGLFHGSKSSERTTPDRPRDQHFGTIYVEENTSTRLPYDESLVLSYGDENHYVSSIMSFWKGDAKPHRLPRLRLGGQDARSVSLLPRPTHVDGSSGAGIFDTSSTTPPNFLVQTSHRLILSLNPLSPQQMSTGDASRQGIVADRERGLVEAGDMDIEDMDRMLDDMGGGGAASKRPMNLFTKSVGFRIDDDDENDDDGSDVDMGSPTPAKYRASRLQRSENPVPQRRIFT